VIVPERNRKDWEDVPAEVRQRIKAHFVQHISELLPLVLK
jgi:ATP-dependent Lon protease